MLKSLEQIKRDIEFFECNERFLTQPEKSFLFRLSCDFSCLKKAVKEKIKKLRQMQGCLEGLPALAKTTFITEEVVRISVEFENASKLREDSIALFPFFILPSSLAQFAVAMRDGTENAIVVELKGELAKSEMKALPQGKIILKLRC